jgi:hypothetical protein
VNDPETAIADGHECVVLSALMNGEDSLPVCADDFSSPPNRMIFNCVSGLSDRCFIAVTDALRCNGQLERVGGAGRITEIATLPHDQDNLKYALDQMLEHSRTRQAAKIGEQMHKGEITPEQAQEKLATLIKTKANTTEREPRIRFFSPPFAAGLRTGQGHRSYRGLPHHARRSVCDWWRNLVLVKVSARLNSPFRERRGAIGLDTRSIGSFGR